MMLSASFMFWEQAGEEEGGREDAGPFDAANSHLPPNFFLLQNLLVNFKGLLAARLNPVHWDL